MHFVIACFSPALYHNRHADTIVKLTDREGGVPFCGQRLRGMCFLFGRPYLHITSPIAAATAMVPGTLHLKRTSSTRETAPMTTVAGDTLPATT